MSVNTGATLEKEEFQKIFFGLALEAQKQLPSKFPERKKRVIVLAGPTGVGKTEFAIELARICGGEILSADSMQVYRGMDIGTAKASEEQRQRARHHLLDIRDIKESFNVVDYYYEARHTTQQLMARGSVPIFVGGSGFYIHSLIYGPPSGPPSIPEVRIKLEEEMEKFGHEALYDRLRKLDKEYANTITKNDKQKIIRGLEIITLTGKPVSKLSWKSRTKMQNYDFRCWFLHRPRETLFKSVERRCEEMLEMGLLEEVKTLIEQGILENSSAAQAIGYRQAIDYLNTAQTPKDYEEFVARFKHATRNYIKRQYTWFRKEPLFRWLDLDLHDPEIAMDMIISDYKGPPPSFQGFRY